MKLKDAVAYICQKYPNRDELSKARLTKMIYLADWKSAILNGRQLTDIQWVFNHFGPYVDDVVSLAKIDEDFDLVAKFTVYGNQKYVVALKGQYQPSLAQNEKQIIDSIIETTSSLYWNDFIRLVYSTFPIRTQPRYIPLDLPKLAKNYKTIEGWAC